MNFETYKSDVCWQYNIRITNYEKDILESGLSIEELSNLKVEDFKFLNEDKKLVYPEVKAFINRHEWLGRMSLHPTHIFTARYKGILAGVIVMDMPTVFSKMLGEETKKLERLVSRGACISWSPKNLGSSLLMFSIRWAVKNTDYRLFTAYSDVEALELGTIYQACNFYYLGKNSGTNKQYKIAENKWVSDRYFRARSVYKRLAKWNRIIWQSEWQNGESIIWKNVPEEIEVKLRTLSKEWQDSCEFREVPAKHKYAYVLGRTKAETKRLRKTFLEKNNVFEYPKERGN